LFRQQRQLTLHLLIDGSGSMHVPSHGPADELTQRRTPFTVASEVAGLLALVAAAEQDRVGMTLFTDAIEQSVQPQQGSQHVLRLLRDLLAWRPAGAGTRLDLPLQRLLRTQRLRS